MLSKLALLFHRPAPRDPYMDALKEIHSGVRAEKPTKAALIASVRGTGTSGAPSEDAQTAPVAQSAAAASHSRAVTASRLLR